jgi:phospholipid/cholesterol/gamma-HCH transport system substrate-binding protein
MKKQFFTEVRVGLFVLFGLVFVMIAIFMLGSEKRLFENFYTIYSKFEDISGLRVGAAVQLAGLDVGMVDEIRFSKDISEKEVTVVLRLNTKFQDRIRADSVATINTQGLLGDKFIYISVGSPLEPVLDDGAFIKTEEAVPIYQLAEKAGKIMDDIGDAAEAIKTMLVSVEGEKDGDFKMTLKSVRTTLERIQKGPGLAHALIYDPEGKQVVERLSVALKSISDLTTGISEEGKKETRGLVTNLRMASADLEKILSGIRRGEGTLGKLVRDPELYNDLRAFLGKANRSKLIRAVVRTTIEENDKQIIK